MGYGGVKKIGIKCESILWIHQKDQKIVASAAAWGNPIIVSYVKNQAIAINATLKEL